MRPDILLIVSSHSLVAASEDSSGMVFEIYAMLGDETRGIAGTYIALQFVR